MSLVLHEQIFTSCITVTQLVVTKTASNLAAPIKIIHIITQLTGKLYKIGAYLN